MNRRTFLGVSALGSRALALTAQSEAPSSKPAPVKAFELDEITISELAEGMQSGREGPGGVHGAVQSSGALRGGSPR